MAKRIVGKVGALWRYPVKSMLGEKLDRTSVTQHGVAGDRGWALREASTGRVVSAKKYPKLFEMRAAYEGSPDGEVMPPVRITLPGGKTIHAHDSSASETISAVLGCSVRIDRAQHGEHNQAAIDPATVFGEVGIANIFPGMTQATAPDFFPLPEGTFFDSATIHVLAGATLEHMYRLNGSNGRFDPRRFRANIYVETEGAADGFVEDEWLGGMLEVGDSVKITAMQPALRCVMTTHPQEDLEHDPSILRVAAKNHRAMVGVFASVGSGGMIRVGDPIVLVK
jgi:uncharacterized protein YcbX